MKLILRIMCTAGLGLCLSQASAQTCPSGYASASVNWDALDYIPTTGYSNSVATALAPKQNFAFGKNKINITYTGVTSAGENALHSGGGAGEDVQFSGDGTITISFAAAVTNLKFSIYDIDKGQEISFVANNAGVAAPVLVTKAVPTSTDITVVGSTVTGTSQDKAENTNTCTANVEVPGAVTSITLTITKSSTTTNSDKNFWLSDISACATGSFPDNNYYQVSKPHPGMPGYVLVSINNSVYMVDPATGKAKYIFTDGATSGTLNSLAYDPYNKIIYYCYSLTNNGSASASDRRLRKYDMNTGIATTVLSDINSLGIPTFDQGTESGAAAFYDGALYLGIEGGAESTGGGKTATYKESIIWRIDFDSNLQPTGATQVFGVDGDKHDWSDFSITNGILYDFNGDAGNEDYHNYNLMTGENILKTWSGVTPKQSAVGWDGKVYWVSDRIAEYNLNGGVGTLYPITSTPAIPNWSNTSAPSFGDAAEAYRPKVDFGDAPLSYDLNLVSPAIHESIPELRLGSTLVTEWDRTTAVNTDADDDGLAYPRILNTSGGNYQTDVNVFNNTGVPATLAGWVDFNGDNQFQTNEGVTLAVPSSTTSQVVNLYWSGIANDLPTNSYTYLRLRITTASGMSAATPAGYFANGEVEDYNVVVNPTTLAVQLASFSAHKSTKEDVSVKWAVTNEEQGTKYVLQQSTDGSNWKSVYSTTAVKNNASAAYSYTDAAVRTIQTFYRLLITGPGGAVQYSKIEKISFKAPNVVNIYPNPTPGNSTITVNATTDAVAKITLVDLAGKPVYVKSVPLQKGSNSFSLPVAASLPEGVYSVQIAFAGELYIQKLIINKNQ